MDKSRLLRIARGEELADLVIKNAKIINVYTKDIDLGNLAIAEGIIIGIGDYSGKEEIDMSGYYVAPGFIDGHVHIESSMLTPNNYARAVLKRGTTSVVADCHEIANVLGETGIDFMLDAAKNSGINVFMMIPSCVPSTQFETSGAILQASHITKYKKMDNVIGLGEMMDYPGAINGDKDVLEKIKAFDNLVIDGHAPEVNGKNLNAYRLNGILTDHECTTPKELIDKVKLGMYVHLREGSQTKNLSDLLDGLNPKYYNRILFCSDDLHPSDIKNIGHIDNNINIAIKNGIDPIEAISMATVNIAECYNIRNVGAIAPGKNADLVCFKDLDKIVIEHVFKEGKLVLWNRQLLLENCKIDINKVTDTVRIDLENIDLSIRVNKDLVHVIGLIKNNVTTYKLIEKINLEDGLFLPKNNPGLLKLCVIERHKLSGNIGRGIVKGYGMKSGALAMTIAHDSHNLICLGDNDEDMLVAIKKIKDIGGGIVLVSNNKVLDFLCLEVAGLMSSKSIEYVEEKLINLERSIRKLGVNEEIEDPFLQLAFLSLAVIPELKLTDMGLFDVSQYKMINLEAGD